MDEVGNQPEDVQINDGTSASVSNEQRDEAVSLLNGDFQIVDEPTNIEEKLELAEKRIESLEKELNGAKESIFLHEKEKEMAAMIEEKLSIAENEIEGFLAERERLKALELEIARLTTELNGSESKVTQLKDDIGIIEGKLEEATGNSVTLKENEEALKEQLAAAELKAKEAEEKITLQTELLQGEMESRAHKEDELNSARAAMDRFDAELAQSTEKIANLEGQLKSSMDKAEEYEELIRQHELHASKSLEKAMEFENLSALSESRAKEKEELLASLHDEIQGLHEKLHLKDQIEEDLKETESKLTAVQQGLRDSQEQALELKEKLRSAEGTIEELMNGLSVHQVTEVQMKEGISALEKFCASSEENLKLKMVEIDELNNKLQEVVEANHLLEVNLKQEELKSSDYLEDLENTRVRCGDLESTIAQYNGKISELEESCGNFQNQVKVSEDNLKQEELKSSDYLEDLENTRVRCGDLESTIAQLNGKISELEESCGNFQNQVKVSEDKISALEASFDQSSASNAEMEQKLKSLEEVLSEHEAHASNSRQRGVELEDLIAVFRDKAEDNAKRVTELGSLLETATQEKCDLENQLKLAETRFMETETEARQSSEKMKEDISALEELCSSSEENLKLKMVEINELNNRLQEVLEANRFLEDNLKQEELKSSDFLADLESARVKCGDLESTVAQLNEKISELEESCVDFQNQVKVSEDKISALEASFDQSSARNAEMEKKLKSLEEVLSEHEAHATNSRQRGVELEDLVAVFRDKAEDNAKKVTELESLLEIATQEKCDLENQLKLAETRFMETETEAKQFSEQVSELRVKMEDSLERIKELEGIQVNSREKEQELEESISLANQEVASREDVVNQLTGKLLEAENKIEFLQLNYKDAQDKLDTLEIDLKSAIERESELKALVKDTGEQLAQQTDVFMLSSREAEDKIGSFKLDLDNYALREAELQEKLEVTLEQLKEKKTTAEQAVDHCEELEQSLQEFKANTQQQIHEHGEQLNLAEARCRETEINAKEFSEKANELKAKFEDSVARVLELETILTNSSLREKDLDESLNVAKENIGSLEEISKKSTERHLELENLVIALENNNNDVQTRLSALQEDLQSALVRETELQAKLKNAEEQLTDKENVSRELSAKYTEMEQLLESQTLDKETKLQEAYDKHMCADSQVQLLIEKINVLEGQLKDSEDRATQASELATMSQSKLQQSEVESEVLAEKNSKLNEELVCLQSKVDELQTEYRQVQNENELLAEQVTSSLNRLNNLTEQLAKERQQHESQISSVMEDNNELIEKYSSIKNEFDTLLSQKESELKKATERELTFTANLDDLKGKLSQSAILQGQVEELEQKLHLAELKLQEESESALRKSEESKENYIYEIENLKDKLRQAALLETQVAELEQKLQLADSKVQEQNEIAFKQSVEREAMFKAELEDMHGKLCQIPALQAQMAELEDKLRVADLQLQEQTSSGMKLAEEREATLKAEIEDLRAKLSGADMNKKQLADLEQKLQEKESKLQDQIETTKKYSEKMVQAAKEIQSLKDRLAKPSQRKGKLESTRDIGTELLIHAEKKDTIKSKSVVQSVPVASTSTVGRSTESFNLSIKFVLVIALISVLFGLIIGRRS